MEMTFSEIIKLFSNHTLNIDLNSKIPGISHDTRTLKPGEIFAAIRGENFDGHDFIDQAFSKGASAVLLDSKKIKRANLICVDDVVLALGKIATHFRKKFTQPVIAVTGSSGKTTTKDFLAHVLSRSGKVIATEGNFNNHIGVPQTVFSFTNEAKYFIVEMGMSHLEEIRYLAKMVQPDVGLITNIGRAHLEGVGGSIAGVKKAKGELFEELKEHNTAFVFRDDPNIWDLATKAKKKTFGFHDDSDVWASDIHIKDNQTFFVIHFENQQLSTVINMIGRHHIQNALAVFSIARHFGMDAKAIQDGIESFVLRFNRGKILHQGKLTLVDDTYNANPDSMMMSLQAVVEQFPQNYKIAVLGGMGELGESAPDMHMMVGQHARKLGYDDMYVLGDHSELYLKGFGLNDDNNNKRQFADHAGLAEALKENISEQKKDVVILLKGSRIMKMEKVLGFFNP